MLNIGPWEMLILAVNLLILVGLIALPIASLVISSRLNKRITVLETRLAQLAKEADKIGGP